MATLTPTLTLESTDATSDTLSFSVTDTLTVTDPQIGLSKIAATKTKAEREAKGAAFDLSQKQKEQVRAFGETTANKAIEVALANKTSNAKTINDQTAILVREGLEEAGKNRTAAIKAINAGYTIDKSNNTLSDQVVYARKNPTTGEMETLVFYDKAGNI